MKNDLMKQPPSTITSILTSPAFKKQLLNVLPKSLTPDRLVRIAMTELRMNPKLGQCDPMSFVGAVMRCAQIGLEPSSERQLVYLIPYGRECKVMVGYRGFLALASKANVYIESDVVYENDTFEFQKGLETKLKFIPAYSGDRGKVSGAYAMARVCLPDGTIIFVPEFMPKSEIDKVMTFSKTSTENSIWGKHYDAMARKSVIRRLFKYLPLSSELDEAVSADELADRNAQENATLVSEEIINSIEPKEAEEPQSKAEGLANMLEDEVKE